MVEAWTNIDTHWPYFRILWISIRIDFRLRVTACSTATMAARIASLDCKSKASPANTPGAFATDPCFFSRGAHTYRVPLGLHADNRAALLKRLENHAPGVCLFVGGDAHERNDTDHEELFRQESYFQYLFGVAEPGWFGTVALPSGKATLFAPELGPEYAVWMGKIATREERLLNQLQTASKTKYS